MSDWVSEVDHHLQLLMRASEEGATAGAKPKVIGLIVFWFESVNAGMSELVSVLTDVL